MLLILLDACGPLSEAHAVKPSDFQPSFPGELVQFADSSGAVAWAFVPHRLPVQIQSDDEITAAAVSAGLALGSLEGASLHIKNPALFLQPPS